MAVCAVQWIANGSSEIVSWVDHENSNTLGNLGTVCPSMQIGPTVINSWIPWCRSVEEFANGHYVELRVGDVDYYVWAYGNFVYCSTEKAWSSSAPYIGGAPYTQTDTALIAGLSGNRSLLITTEGSVYLSGSQEELIACPVDYTNYASWMGDLENLGDFTLFEIAIPGAHDAVSYNIPVYGAALSEEGQNQIDEWWGPAAMELVNIVVGSQITAWARSQGLSLTDQLNAGIRYFDIRSALDVDSDGNQTVRGTHFQFTEDSMETLLNEVKAFIDCTSAEIVILDFNHFYGANPSSAFGSTTDFPHQDFVDNTLTPLFASIAVTELNDTIGEMLDSGQRVVILYSETKEIKSAPSWLHNSKSNLTNTWYQPNTSQEMLKGMTKELTKKQKSPPTKMYMLQGVYAPESSEYAEAVLSTTYDGLWYQAQTSTPDTIGWLAQLSSADRLLVNIVEVDWAQYTNAGESFMNQIIAINNEKITASTP